MNSSLCCSVFVKRSDSTNNMNSTLIFYNTIFKKRKKKSSLISKLYKVVTHNHDFIYHLPEQTKKGSYKVSIIFEEWETWLHINVP